MKLKHKKLIYVLCIFDALLLMVLGCLAFMSLGNNVPNMNIPSNFNGATVVNPYINLNDKPEFTPAPTPVVAIEKDHEAVSATNIAIKWDGDKTAEYVVNFREPSEESWHRENVTGCYFEIHGLKPNTKYEYRVKYKDANSKGYRIDGQVQTLESGYGDPFRNIHAELKMLNDADDVTMTNSWGALGCTAWVEFDSKLYKDNLLTEEISALKGGTQCTVAADELGDYGFLKENGRWSLRVQDVDGNTGWVDADVMLIDLAYLFNSGGSIYGIQINRTNAYCSIFSTGGSIEGVDTTSDPKTRFNCLEKNATVFAKTGYNVIDNITGQALPNYGSKDQMPVIWDLALELITCQKNALKKGTTLYIYEGYRPRSTSEAVYKSLSGSGYLEKSVNGTNLAKGTTNKNYGTGDYIAYNSKHNKGIAVDLTIVEFADLSTLGNELKMQTKIHTLDFRCNMAYNTQSANMLYEIMMNNTNLEPLKSRAEWWHFQLINDSKIYPQIGNYVFADYKI